MANPMPNEDKLYQVLKDENAEVHPIIWQILDHHIRNDLFVIMAVIEDSSGKNQRLTGKKKKKIFQRIKNITSIIEKLKRAVNWDGKYYSDISKFIEELSKEGAFL